MASFLIGFQQQLHELHVEEAGTWQQSTPKQICLEIGNYNKVVVVVVVLYLFVFLFPIYLCEI